MDELVPKLLGLGEIQKVLQNLLREGISIRDLLTILETLADYAPTTKGYRYPDGVCETELKESNLHQVFPFPRDYQCADAGSKDRAGSHGKRKTDRDRSFPESGSRQKQSNSQCGGRRDQKLENMGKTPIIMTSPIVRMYFKRLTEDYYPDLVVVSYNEVESNVELQSVGMVTA